jgi:hypothetical protein
MLNNVKHLPVIATKAALHRAIEGEMNSRLRGNAKFWQLAGILSQSLCSTQATFAASIDGGAVSCQISHHPADCRIDLTNLAVSTKVWSCLPLAAPSE